MWIRFLVLAVLLGAGCATAGFNRLERYHALSEKSREAFDKYHQFMTEGQQERFLDGPDDEARQRLLVDLHVEERLARYPKYVQDAIWSQDVVPGMDTAAVLLSWGKPDEVERPFHEDNRGVDQQLWIYRRGPTGKEDRRVTVVQGVVTAVEKP